MRPLHLFALALLWMVIGCGDDVTSAVIVVRSELPAGDLDRLRVTVARGSEAPQQREVTLGPGDASFPVRVAILYESGALGPVRASVVGTGADGSVSATADPFYFSLREKLTIPITLRRACVGVSCGPGERCVDGSCQDLPMPDAGAPADGGPVGEDAGRADAGADAGMCAEGCTCFLHEECVEAHCDCEKGCGCEFYCAPGETCGELHCKDEGTTCSVSARNAADVTVHCDDTECGSVDVRGTSNTLVRCRKENGCCIVDCTGASNCFVDCEDGAYCRVDCTDSSNCGFTGEGSCWAEDNPLDCGGGVQVCGAESCPPTDACQRGVEPD